jgi:hypothetical protein
MEGPPDARLNRRVERANAFEADTRLQSWCHGVHPDMIFFVHHDAEQFVN